MRSTPIIKHESTVYVDGQYPSRSEYGVYRKIEGVKFVVEHGSREACKGVEYFEAKGKAFPSLDDAIVAAKSGASPSKL